MRSPRTTAKSSPRSPQLEKAHAQQQRPNAAKNKLINYFKNKTKQSILTNTNLAAEHLREILSAPKPIN